MKIPDQSEREIIRVMRLYIFEGDRIWVENQLEKSIQGTKVIDYRNTKYGGGKITGITIDQFPEIIKQHECITNLEEKDIPKKLEKELNKILEDLDE